MIAVSMNTKPSIRLVRIFSAASGWREMPSEDLAMAIPMAMAPAAPEEPGDQIRAKDITIDRTRRAVYKNGKELELTQREYELIKFLAENPGRVMSREELMGSVWQYDYFGDLRAVDVAVRRLREKLEDNPSEPVYVMTKRGAGYYFAD